MLKLLTIFLTLLWSESLGHELRCCLDYVEKEQRHRQNSPSDFNVLFSSLMKFWMLFWGFLTYIERLSTSVESLTRLLMLSKTQPKWYQTRVTSVTMRFEILMSQKDRLVSLNNCFEIKILLVRILVWKIFISLIKKS